MRKKLTVLLLLLFTFTAAHAEYSLEDELVVGLSAYQDGIYDVARASLTDYINGAKGGKNSAYAKFILYHIAVSEKKYDEVVRLIGEIENVSDKRIDKKKLITDMMAALVQVDCTKAAERFQTAEEPVALLYLNSSCPVTDSVLDRVINAGFSKDTMLIGVSKSVKNKDQLAKLYKAMKEKGVAPKEYKFFGIAFFKNAQYDLFWDVYGQFKDEEMVRLALSRQWDTQSLDAYVSTFEQNKNHYSLASGEYCRAIKAYQTLERTYDCSLMDSCFTTRDDAYYQSKLACIAKGKDVDSIYKFVNTVPQSSFSVTCSVTPFLVANGKYSSTFLEKITVCNEAADVARYLYNKKDIAHLMILTDKTVNDELLYYRALAFIQAGERGKATAVMSSMTNPELRENLRSILSK